MAKLTAGESKFEFFLTELSSLNDGSVVLSRIVGSNTVESLHFKSQEDSEKYIRSLNPNKEVIFVNKYLTQNELASYYQDSSLILLYYKNSFKSQSGILNGIISYSTPIIISDINCAMTETAKKYKIAQIVEPDNAQKLSQAINNLEEVNIENRKIFISENSWRKNIEIQINTYKNIIGK